MSLLNILDLFAHLLDQYFQFNCGLGAFGNNGFGRQGVGLAVELLH